MNKIIIIFLVVFSVQETLSQNLMFKNHKDSLNLWEYSFNDSSLNETSIGSITLARIKPIYSDDKIRQITPQITYQIYPLIYLDSITKIESERMKSISCCYPICGSTIETTENFVFWSSSWSIISALECNGIDYTRQNAALIINAVKNQNFKSIEELIAKLPIKKNIN